jgi:aminoglycoside phosphotransferase (APT) family kinase protein
MLALDDPQVRAAAAAYARRRGFEPADDSPTLSADGPFATGLSSGGVQRVSLPLANGNALPLLWKHTTAAESVALRALREVDAADGSYPVLIAAGADARGHWVLIPLSEGVHPPTRHDAPPDVFDTLAAIHHHWEGQTGELSGLISIDTRWWRHLCLEYLAPRLEALGSDLTKRAAGAVAATAGDERIAAALDHLPVTLVHGDMHEANMIVGAAATTIIDWGDARRGPAMLDVANIARRGSPMEQRYLRERERLSGVAIAPDTVEIGHRWAQAQITTQYLAYVAEHRPAAELEAMLQARERALDRLGAAL